MRVGRKMARCGILSACTGWLHTAKDWARRIKRDVLALWIAARDARTPVVAKLTAGAVAAYALSPIDLIPDFVPVLGYLDDVVIVPLGILATVKLIPAPLMTEFREAAVRHGGRPTSRAGMAIIVTIWTAALVVTAWWIYTLG